MKPNRKTWWLPMLGIALPMLGQTQNPPHLTMDQAVEISARNSQMVQNAELDKRIAKSNREQTDAIFLPQISLGYQALFTNDPLNAFGFLLQQRKVTAADFDPARLNQPGNAQSYGANVEFQMPLLNVDKIYARKGAKLQEEMYAHQAEYTKDNVRFEVQKAYTQLQFAYQAKEILDSTLNDVKGIHRAVSNFYHQGLLQKSDVLNAQVQVNIIESALQTAESNISNASDGLRLLMGEDLNKASGVYRTDGLEAKAYLPENRSFSTFRSDIVAMQKAVEASKMQKKSMVMAYVPTINAFGTYQFSDDKIFRFNDDSYMVGISLRWTIFSGNMNRGKYRSASFQHDKMRTSYDLYVNKSRIEVERNRRTINDLSTEMKKQKLSVEQAYEALRIMKNRHKEGLVSTTDLLLAQAQYSQQRLALAQSVMNYNIACYYQDILTQSL